MPINFYLYFIVALIPLVLGSIYYNPRVFGSAWMKSNGFTEESLRGGNMVVIFGLSYLLSFMMSFMLTSMVIHQNAMVSMFIPEVLEKGSAIQQEVSGLLAKYGDRSRSFGHGALHGFLVSLFIGLPIIGITALFERRSGKYIFIHFGYFALCLALMGGILCKYLVWAPLGS